MNRIVMLVVLGLGMVVGSSMLLRAAVGTEPPRTIPFSGTLERNGDKLSGTVDFTFTIYPDATSTTVLWTETQTAARVSAGAFSVELGSVTALPADVFTRGTLHVGVAVDGTPLVHRARIALSGYSVRALEADDFLVRGNQVTNGTLTAAGGVLVTGSLPAFNSIPTPAVRFGSASALTADQGGSLELGDSLRTTAVTPYIDFHRGGASSAVDYDVRLINEAAGRLALKGDLTVSGTTALGWRRVSCSTNDTTCACAANERVVSGGGTAGGANGFEADMLATSEALDDRTWMLQCMRASSQPFGQTTHALHVCASFTIICARVTN